MGTANITGYGGISLVVPTLPTNDGTFLPVGGTVTANIGTTNGLATAAGVQAVVTALGSPLQANGSVVITSQPLPTGAATDTKSEAIRALLAGGIAVTGPATSTQIGSLGLATSAKQDTMQAALNSLVTATQDTTTASKVTLSQSNGTVIPVGASTNALSIPHVMPKGGARTSASVNVALSTTSTVVLAANTARIGGNILNDSTSVAYVRLAATGATSDTYDYFMQARSTSDGTPASFAIPANYTGAVSIALQTGTGIARPVEW